MSYVIKRLFSTAINGWTRQRFSAEGILGRKWWQRREIVRWRCHCFELTEPASWRSG